VLTGMLGLQSRPTEIEAAGWIVYVLAAGAFVVWAGGQCTHRPVPPSTVGAPLDAPAAGSYSVHGSPS
jgi:hypothetical protein